jgi:hypothetical protein
MHNILIACDSSYYETWGINCAASIQKFVPWINIHIVQVNPKDDYNKLKGITYYEEHVDFPNESCKIPYYQALRFLKCSEIFSNNELVMSIDCDTILTRPFNKIDFENICQTIHVQRHQKNIRWMAGLVTYGNNSTFRNEFKEKLLSIPLSEWKYGWDQDVLNELGSKYNYSKLNVGSWMSFGRGGGIFLTLKGDQKIAQGYLEIYNGILKNVQ